MMLLLSTDLLTKKVRIPFEIPKHEANNLGWLVKIVMSDESELEELMDEEKYAEFCAEEAD